MTKVIRTKILRNMRRYYSKKFKIKKLKAIRHVTRFFQ